MIRKTLAPLVVFLAVVLAGSWASAEGSDLPPCKGSDYSKWHNCFGTYTFANGNKYVGEFRDGKYNGQGTFTHFDGRIDKGIWENNELVYSGTKEEYEKELKRKREAKIRAEREATRQKAHENAMDRCLFAHIDKIVSDAAERIVKKKCEKELRDLSISELREAYD